jgi:predicted aspartyl protease
MNMKRLIILTIFAIIGLQSNLISQIQKNPKRFYIENQGKKYIQLPFKLINNLIILSVSVNHSDTLNFILDSGISNTIITDPYIASILNLQYTREIKLCGFGGENSLSAMHSIENEIRIDGILGQHQDILVIQNPDFDFSRHLGIKVHGLIGYNLFRDLILEVNYDSKFIRLYPPRTYVYKLKRNSLVVPLNLTDTKPFINISIMQEDSSIVEGKFLIDTGASFALWIDLFSNDKFILPHKTQSAYLGAGLSGPVNGLVGRIKEFKIGNLKLKNVVTSLPDTMLKNNALHVSDRNGTIGADLLSRFNLIFDYRNNKVTFRPNSKWHEPFLVNLTGMELCCPVPGENSFNISNISVNSPADKAGLKAGDLVESINFQSLANMPFPEIQSLLLKKAGKKMVVQYSREGKVNAAILVLNNSL